MEVTGADHRLAHRGEGALRGEQRLGIDPALEVAGGGGPQHRRQSQRLGDLHAGAAADGLAVDLRQPADISTWKAPEEVLGVVPLGVHQGSLQSLDKPQLRQRILHFCFTTAATFVMTE